ncbi:MAG: cystathionine gamma-lyase [Henriciella sp.]|nr:cystathionine gamma-lyase [Henriciella sp.]
MKPVSERLLKMLHQRSSRLQDGEPLSPPVVTTAKYRLDPQPGTEFSYGRDANPTVMEVEAAIGALEEAECVAFPSGMASITAALMVCLRQGGRILVPSDGYYTIRLLLEDFLVEMGLDIVTCPTRDYATQDLAGFDLVWIETPSNPGLDVCDIAEICTRAKVAGAKTVVDNTSATPLLQQPLDLGADMVVSSDTKAMSGHSDVLFGHVASRDADLLAKARSWRKLSGAVAGPFEAFLVHRGLMTLDVRLERMCTSAQRLAELFVQSNKLETVRYPGLPADPSFALAQEQMVKPGFVIGLYFANEAMAEAFIANCTMVFPATSFGGVHTSAERRARWGDDVPAGFVRLSVGCEPEAALVAAVREALDGL